MKKFNEDLLSDVNELYSVMRELYPQLKEREKHYDEVKKVVYNFNKKYEQGFTQGEIDELLEQNYPNINLIKFNSALKGITCCVHPKTKQVLTYDIDIVRAIVCGIENRELTLNEWD